MYSLLYLQLSKNWGPWERNKTLDQIYQNHPKPFCNPYYIVLLLKENIPMHPMNRENKTHGAPKTSRVLRLRGKTHSFPCARQWDFALNLIFRGSKRRPFGILFSMSSRMSGKRQASGQRFWIHFWQEGSFSTS